MFHNVKIFHWNCLIICCYQCQQYSHTIKICRFTQKCEFCAETNHRNNQCLVKNNKKFSCYSNYNKAHSAWTESCKSLQKVKKHTIYTYNNWLTCFAVNTESKIKNNFNSDWIIVSVTDKKKIISANITEKNSDESQKKNLSRFLENKNTLIKFKKKINSQNIHKMFHFQQKINIMNLF